MSSASTPELPVAMSDLDAELVQTTKQLAVFSKHRSVTSPAPYPAEGLKYHPRVHNVFGVLGPRGSGKSHMLVNWWQFARAQPARYGGFTVLPPIDSSLHPREQPLVLTVFHELRRRVRAITAARSLSPCQSHQLDPAVQLADERFQVVCETLARGTRSAQRVLRGVSTTVADYGRIVRAQTERRLGLPQQIQDWLDAEVSLCDGSVKGFILLLDDIDLVAPDDERDFLLSILDELHQDRLVLVLAAHLPRLLEHLQDPLVQRRRTSAARPGLKGRGTLARELLYKAMPGTHRVQLGPWTLDERQGFTTPAPPGAREEAKTLQAMLESTGWPPYMQAHASHLLPPYPRGLEDVHRWLASRVAPASTRGAPAARPNLQAFLIQLANARGEPFLADHLRAHVPWTAAWELGWKDGSVGQRARWSSLVRRARSLSEPLTELAMDRSGRGLPLADLEGEVEPRWIEFLLDLAANSHRFGRAEAPPDPPHLSPPELGRIHPAVSEHLGGGQANIVLTADLWRRHRREPDRPRAATLFWVQPGAPTPHGDVPTRMGWLPALEALHGERSLLPPEAKWELDLDGIDELDSYGEVSHPWPDGPEAHPLVPATLRPLLLVSNALSEGPWKVLEQREPLKPPVGYARLAAALTMQAMVRAFEATQRGGEKVAWRRVHDELAPEQVVSLFDKHGDTLSEWFAALPAVPALPKSPSYIQKDLHDCMLALRKHPTWVHLGAPKDK